MGTDSFCSLPAARVRLAVTVRIASQRVAESVRPPRLPPGSQHTYDTTRQWSTHTPPNPSQRAALLIHPPLHHQTTVYLAVQRTQTSGCFEDHSLLLLLRRMKPNTWREPLGFDRFRSLCRGVVCISSWLVRCASPLVLSLWCFIAWQGENKTYPLATTCSAPHHLHNGRCGRLQTQYDRSQALAACLATIPPDIESNWRSTFRRSGGVVYPRRVCLVVGSSGWRVVKGDVLIEPKLVLCVMNAFD